MAESGKSQIFCVSPNVLCIEWKHMSIYVEAWCWSALVRGVNEYGDSLGSDGSGDVHVVSLSQAYARAYPDCKPNDFCIAWDQ